MESIHLAAPASYQAFRIGSAFVVVCVTCSVSVGGSVGPGLMAGLTKRAQQKGDLIEGWASNSA